MQRRRYHPIDGPIVRYSRRLGVILTQVAIVAVFLLHVLKRETAQQFGAQEFLSLARLSTKFKFKIQNNVKSR
jgi:hypothetical protein